MIDLIQGDCLIEMKDIPDGSIDAIICDLPYGTTNCKWDSVIPFEPLWEQYNRVIKDNGAIVLFGSQPFTSALVMSNPKMFKYEWIWHKNKVTDIFNAKTSPLKAHENIIVFAENRNFTFNHQMEKRSANSHTKGEQFSTGKGIYNGANNSSKAIKKGELSKPKSVQYFKCIHWADKEKEEHPTQKPLGLLEYLVKTYSNENDTILDNTMGSGTTMLACQNTNRNGIGIELDQGYFEIAQKRVAENSQRLNAPNLFSTI